MKNDLHAEEIFIKSKSKRSFSFKNLLNISSNSNQEQCEKNDRKGKHLKQLSMSSFDFRQIYDTQLDKLIYSKTKPTRGKSALERSNYSEEYNLTPFFSLNLKENKINISDYDFENVYSDDDKEAFKQIGIQKLNYLIFQLQTEGCEDDTEINENIKQERQEDRSLSKSADRVSQISKKSKLRSKSNTPKVKKHKEICHKFKENPKKFFTEPPSEVFLKSLNISSKITKDSDINFNGSTTCIDKPINKTEDALEELNLSAIKEEIFKLKGIL